MLLKDIEQSSWLRERKREDKREKRIISCHSAFFPRMRMMNAHGEEKHNNRLN